jgi:ABC-type transporter Mla subunit MlaD
MHPSILRTLRAILRPHTLTLANAVSPTASGLATDLSAATTRLSDVTSALSSLVTDIKANLAATQAALHDAGDDVEALRAAAQASVDDGAAYLTTLEAIVTDGPGTAGTYDASASETTGNGGAPPPPTLAPVYFDGLSSAYPAGVDRATYTGPHYGGTNQIVDMPPGDYFRPAGAGVPDYPFTVGPLGGTLWAGEVDGNFEVTYTPN